VLGNKDGTYMTYPKFIQFHSIWWQEQTAECDKERRIREDMHWDRRNNSCISRTC